MIDLIEHRQTTQTNNSTILPNIGVKIKQTNNNGSLTPSLTPTLPSSPSSALPSRVRLSHHESIKLVKTKLSTGLLIFKFKP
jgi:hypothetical protein